MWSVVQLYLTSSKEARINVTAEYLADNEFTELIKHYEGFRGLPYLCPAGYPTVGYGHLIKKGEKFTTTLTEEEATKILGQDLIHSAQVVYKYCPFFFDGNGYLVKAHETKFMALVSFVFNLGEPNFKNSTLLKVLKKKDWQGASEQILRWDKARVKGKMITLAGLTKRRQSEAHYFLTGGIVLP